MEQGEEKPNFGTEGELRRKDESASKRAKEQQNRLGNKNTQFVRV